MKKILFYSSAAMLIGLASCSQDDLQAPAQEGNVNFTVSVPASALGTRAFADGLTANDLQLAVYDAESGELVLTKDQVFAEGAAGALETTVSLNLAGGKQYQIAFFAHKQAGSAYTFDTANKKVTVDYSKMNTSYNTDAFDCFYKLYETGTVTGPINETITLTRPVAQVNWGTSDLEEPVVTAPDAYGAGAANLVTKITTKAYTEFDMLTSDVVTGTETEVVLPYLARPAATETFPYEPATYDYVSMQYLLVPAASSVVDLTLEASNSAAGQAITTVTVANAPVQANYRTNIFGALLTNSAEFKVVKEPNFTDEILQPIGVKEPTQDKDGNYIVSTPEQLAYLSAYPAIWKGKTVKLANDIDLKGMSWTPIGSASDMDTDDENIATFKGTFDGQNHTIKNFVSIAKGDNAMAGLFGSVRGNIKNLKIENAHIESDHYAGALVAYFNCHTGAQYDNVQYPAAGFEISNIEVNNSTIITRPNLTAGGEYDNGDKAGALIGYLRAKVKITQCDVRGNTIEGYRDLGGMVGHVYTASQGNTVFESCWSISNTLVQNFENGYKSNNEVLETVKPFIGNSQAHPIVRQGYNADGAQDHSNVIIRKNIKPDTAEALEAAFKGLEDGAVIEVAAGNYDKFNGNGFVRNKKFTVRGAGMDKTVITLDNYAFHNCDITFENLTIKIAEPGGSYKGVSNYKKGAFKNVKFVGSIWSWGGEGVTYTNCEFDTNGKDAYPVVIIYTAKADFNNCKFTAAKGRGIGMWSDNDDAKITAARDINVKDCTFVVTGDAKDKAVVDVHTEKATESYRGTINISNITFDASKFGGGVWREYINTGDEPKTDYFTFIVDGKVEQKSSRL